MTAKAILPSAKPSNVAETFVMMPTIIGPFEGALIPNL
jgi:hypothetical protein